MATKKRAREGETVFVCTQQESTKGEAGTFDVFAVCDSVEAAEAACREKAMKGVWKGACMEGKSAPYNSREDDCSHDNDLVVIDYCSQQVKSRTHYPASEGEEEEDDELTECFCIYCGDDHPANEEGGVAGEDYGEELDTFGWDVDATNPKRGCCADCWDKLEEQGAEPQTWYEYHGPADGSYFDE